MRRIIVERARGPVQRMCYGGMPMPPPPGMVPYPPDMSYVPPPPKPAKHANEYIKKTPLNFGVCVVPQGELWVAERFGKYHRTVEPGLNFLVPGVDRISYVYNSKEQAHEIPDQAAITKDNVIINIDGILFMKIINAKNASYSMLRPLPRVHTYTHPLSTDIDNPIYNLINVAQTAMRSEIGKLSLDKLFEERSSVCSCTLLRHTTTTTTTAQRTHQGCHPEGLRRLGCGVPPLRNQGHPGVRHCAEEHGSAG